MAAFFEGFVDELIQFDFCKQMQTQRINQIGQVPFVLSHLLKALSKMMAIKDVQIWILTAFSLVPTKDLMRKWDLMCLKNTSKFHRSLFNSATVAAVHCLWFVKNTNSWPVAGSMNSILLSV